DLTVTGVQTCALPICKVSDFTKQNNYSFTVPMDDKGATMKEYMVRGIPTTVIVGRDGNVRKVFIGYGDDSAEKVKKAVEEALARSEERRVGKECRWGG